MIGIFAPYRKGSFYIGIRMIKTLWYWRSRDLDMEQRFDYYKHLAKELEVQKAYPQGNKKIPIRGFWAATSPTVTHFIDCEP